MDIIHVPKRIFAVLYVSIMGLTRCYKTTVFYIYICSFSTKFIFTDVQSVSKNDTALAYYNFHVH